MTFDQHAEKLRKELSQRAFQREDGQRIAFLACCNFGYAQFIYNLHLSLRAIGLDDHLVIACSDIESTKYLTNRGVSCLGIKTEIDLLFNGIEQEEVFAQHVKFKLRNVCEALKGDVDLFIVDGDIAIFKNPLTLEYESVTAQIDDPIDSELSYYLNVGCMIVRANSKTRKVFDYSALEPKVVNNDQPVINEAIRNSDLSVSMLTREDFPNGEYWLRHRPTAPTLIHYNYIFGLKYKRRYMQASDAWFVPLTKVAIRLSGSKEAMAIQLACTTILCSEIEAEMSVLLPDESATDIVVKAPGVHVSLGTYNSDPCVAQVVPEHGLVPISAISEHVEGFTILTGDAPFFLGIHQTDSLKNGLPTLRVLLRRLYLGKEPDDAKELEDLTHIVHKYGAIVEQSDGTERSLDRLGDESFEFGMLANC